MCGERRKSYPHSLYYKPKYIERNLIVRVFNR